MSRPFLSIAGCASIGALVMGLQAVVVAAEPAISSHHHHAAATAAPPVAFVSSRDKAYAALVDDAMAIMSDGMARASMNGNADHDFAAMMVPHHQGAVDMAKAELLYGTNPVLRRLAQEIIITQGQEIEVMQLEMKKILPAAQAKP